MTTDLRASYAAAETFPIKLLLNEGVRKLEPIHVQWMPTNRCNLNCQFCSCSERNRDLEMPLDMALRVIEDFARLGCRSVTITGGGEPLCHPRLSDMVRRFHELGVEVGLVTNGLLLGRLLPEILSLVTWCRISNSDYREFSPRYRELLDWATQMPVDWAFSHVVSREPNLEEIGRIVDYANEKEFTHIRLVGDLLEPEAVPFDTVRAHLKGRDDRVIYQPRKEYTAARSCLIGYVKPLVAPDFKMYLCCGVQYALEKMSRDMPDELCMGNARDLLAVYRRLRAFPVNCVRCYYENYNVILRTVVSEPKHARFL